MGVGELYVVCTMRTVPYDDDNSSRKFTPYATRNMIAITTYETTIRARAPRTQTRDLCVCRNENRFENETNFRNRTPCTSTAHKNGRNRFTAADSELRAFQRCGTSLNIVRDTRSVNEEGFVGPWANTNSGPQLFMYTWTSQHLEYVQLVV